MAAEDFEMGDVNKDEASRRLLDTPEVTVVQSDCERERENRIKEREKRMKELLENQKENRMKEEHKEKEESMEKKIQEEARARKGIKEELEMNEALNSGDFEKSKKFATPQKLTNCMTNCIEKSFEVSHELKRLGKSKRSNAKKFNKLAGRVEDFAFHLLEPLKSNDVKRVMFKEKLFDSVSDRALKHRQKKFVSHPVYNHLMRQQWTGYCANSCFKWVLLNFWTFFDMFLFPLVHFILWVIHLIMKKKKQDLSGIVLIDAALLLKNRQAHETAKEITKQLKKVTSSECNIKMLETENVETLSSETNKDVKKEEHFKKGNKKVLVLITDDISSAINDKKIERNYKEIVSSLIKSSDKVISVGFVSAENLRFHRKYFKYLETMAMNDETNDVFLRFKSNSKKEDSQIIQEIIKCIKGKDIYDCYRQYFNTPYFIFIRDNLSYLALLGLHVAMCLQPSTLHFTAVEWIILVFFLGRFMMEINQFITEKNWEQEENERKNNGEKKPKQIMEKLKKLQNVISDYFHDWWNILDVVTLIVFLVLVGLRIFICSQHLSISKNRLLAVAGYMYGFNAMFLTLRVFGQIMEYNKFTGSIQIALFHIIGAVFIILGQFLVATLAFSLAVTKIYIAELSYSSGKNETSSGLCKSQNGFECWWSFTSHLAWSLLGFTDLTPLQSSDSASDSLAKTLYGLFLIMGVVMLMNMMIALLSNTYQQVEDNAFYEWSFKKATTIRTYTKHHSVPVPFNIISLSYMLLRHIYRTINCMKCKRKESRHKAQLEKQNDRTHEKAIFMYLQEEYFAKYGFRFPMTGKMDRVLKETEGSRMMNRNIAQCVFRYNQQEAQQLESHGDPKWDTRCIAVVGQQLALYSCECESDYHGARYPKPLSEANPEFEVLILEVGERRKVAIGVVTENYKLHQFPGWEGNTAGYDIDGGKIYDSDDCFIGTNGVDAMAYRGDLIGCKILYNEQKDGKLPVSFTLNGRVVGEAKIDLNHTYDRAPFYPYVGIGEKGISLLFRMCFRKDTDTVFQKLKTVSEEQTKLVSNKISTDTDSVIQMLNTISEQQQKTSDRLSELERKMDHPSRLELQEEAEIRRV